VWSTGTGADVMKPIPAPMIGGMISSAVCVLIMTLVIFVMMMKDRSLKNMLRIVMNILLSRHMAVDINLIITVCYVLARQVLLSGQL